MSKKKYRLYCIILPMRMQWVVFSSAWPPIGWLLKEDDIEANAQQIWFHLYGAFSAGEMKTNGDSEE